MQEPQVVPIRTQPDPAQERALLDSTRQTTIKYLVVLLQRMFDNADDALFELADKSASNQEQTSYFDAMRELRRMRQGLEFGFKHHLNDHFDRFIQNPVILGSAKRGPKLHGDDSLSLVDQIDLEESLAITGMIAKIKNRYPHHLNALVQRFQALMHVDELDTDQIPVGPAAICNSFADPLKSLDVELTVKLIIYKLFDKHVLRNLEALFDETNELMVKAGILPRLRQHVIRQAVRGRNSDGADALSELFQEDASPTQRSLDRGAGYEQSMAGATTFDTLRALLNGAPAGGQGTGAAGPGGRGGQGGVSGGFGGVGVSGPGYAGGVATESAEVIDFLSEIQRRNHQGFSVEQFRTELATFKQAGKVNTVDSDIISIVDMLFDFILDDHQLPVVAKALLARLQIPLIKTALLDRTFIADKQHPAKRLLNQMARAAIGLGQEANVEDCPLIAKIEEIVGRICREFASDTSIFATTLEEFEAFMSDEEVRERAIHNAERTRLEEKEHRAMFESWVTEVIATVIHDRRLPRMVFDFLNAPWKEVMIRAYAEAGAHGEHWKATLAFIDKLLWSVDQDACRMDRNRLLKTIPDVITTIRDELAHVGYSEGDIDGILIQLEEIHLSCLHGGEVKQRVRVKAEADSESGAELESITLEDTFGASTNESAADLDEDIEEIIMSSKSYEDQRVAKIRDEHWQSVMDLQMGQWVELSDEEGNSQRAKLAWKSDFLGECTFINWKFKVIADLTFNELAERFRAGQAALLEQLPVFERAVDALLNTLHRRRVSANA